jgi:glutamate N-acetyltransferase/amino-acid N-acetyltransferase
LVDGGEGGARLGALQLVDGGTPTQYAEADAAARFAAPEIDVHVQLGLGEGAAVVWTSDLSHDYVSINADYRT